MRVVHFFGMLKKKSICMKYLYLFSQKKFSPGLPNLGAQIKCAQNRYTAVQTNLKYTQMRLCQTVSILKTEKFVILDIAKNYVFLLPPSFLLVSNSSVLFASDFLLSMCSYSKGNNILK